MFSPSHVHSFIKPFGVVREKRYLLFLVNERGVGEEPINTRLAVLMVNGLRVGGGSDENGMKMEKGKAKGTKEGKGKVKGKIRKKTGKRT